MLSLFLKTIGGVLVGLVGLEVWKISNLLANPRFKNFLWKFAFALGAFFIGRLVAGLIDYRYGEEIGIASYVVLFIFWFGFFWNVRKTRVIIASERMGLDGRHNLSDAIDTIIVEMTQERQRLMATVKV